MGYKEAPSGLVAFGRYGRFPYFIGEKGYEDQPIKISLVKTGRLFCKHPQALKQEILAALGRAEVEYNAELSRLLENDMGIASQERVVNNV